VQEKFSIRIIDKSMRIKVFCGSEDLDSGFLSRESFRRLPTFQSNLLLLSPALRLDVAGFSETSIPLL
jgi:hypothetical protein